MQATRDEPNDNHKKTHKRPKSSARLLKQMPSYIVAFAVHETYDDIATAKQMICNKRSLQGSASSVSPALSSKTITIDRNSAHSTEKIVDADQHNQYVEAQNEIKINNDDGNNKSDDVQNELSEIKDYLLVDEKEEDGDEAESKMNLVESNRTFDVTKTINKIHTIDDNKDSFESIKKPKPPVSKLSKKKRQNKYRIRNVDFKYKKTLKKAENVCKRSEKLKETLYSDSVSKVVSRSSLLKNVPAKVNIIDTTDSFLNSDDENNTNEFLNSSPSTSKKSFTSYSSQDTLRQQDSMSSSRNEGMGSIKTVSSVIKMPSEYKLPYKTDVINVSVAVAYNPLNNNDILKKTTEPHRKISEEDLMSTETLVQPMQMLTSESNSSDTSGNVENMHLQAMDKIDDSDQTLQPKAMSDNTYVVGNSSDMDDSSSRSEDTLAPNSEMFMFSENLRPYDKFDTNKPQNRPALLDTVINMGIFPDINASTSSAGNFNNNLNNVFITGDAGNFLTNATFKRVPSLDKFKETSKQVLKKSFGAENDIVLPKNLNLPDESLIKAIINDETKTEIKFNSGEIGNYPSSMTELWDRLVIVVDTAVKRLENSLTEKIIDEIKKSLTVFEQINRKVKDEIIVVDLEQDKGDIVTSQNEEHFENDLRKEMDEMLQCNLVESQDIDSIMKKLSVESPGILIPGSTKSFQKLTPKIFRDYFEVLKPPTAESTVLEGKGDTVTVSTAMPSEMEDVRAINRIKSMLSAPVACVRENMLVITSVPAFFVAMLLMYGFFFLILKPW